ncbi:FecR family protein [Parabacteroides sp. 52]|uniref:FecR family protein n=1 Tax=unclassified Parabacteroides TaxID=2649774 RepID=UPI0013D4338A|nr:MULTISPECIES: FecR family protein [unclassified Parabacteroides]MDH6535019.1 transmembrane sensor [Parabacteroides sp. PM5-20]NDV55279.1 FecR family protein [Parabacteroides sp. 52]
MKQGVEKEMFKQTGEKCISFLENRPPVSDTATQASWEEVTKRVACVRRKRRMYMIRSSVAALFCGLVFMSYLLYQMHLPVEDHLGLLFETGSMQDVKEVTLLTPTENVVLENEARVEYNQEGNVLINEKVISADKKKKEPKKETPSYNQIIVPYGKRSYLVFTDGTKLSINAGTKIMYPVTFADDKREIYLQGEAYLQVAPDPQRPFYVKTEHFDIKVLGTSFNVSAYKEEVESSIVLVEGSVEMVNKKNTNVRLQPGQKMTIADERISIAEVDVNEYILWKDNILYLGNYKNCGEILTKLARRYNVTIQYDADVQHISIGGKLDFCECIEDALDAVSLLGKFTYVENEGVYYVRLK